MLPCTTVSFFGKHNNNLVTENKKFRFYKIFRIQSNGEVSRKDDTKWSVGRG